MESKSHVLQRARLFDGDDDWWVYLNGTIFVINVIIRAHLLLRFQSSYRAFHTDLPLSSNAAFIALIPSIVISDRTAYKPGSSATFIPGVSFSFSRRTQYSMIRYCRCCPAILFAFLVSSLRLSRDDFLERETDETVGSARMLKRREYAAA